MNTKPTIKSVEAYLFFDGCCEQAVAFYQKTLGAEVGEMMRFKDNPEPQQSSECAPADPNKVMHVSFRIGNTTVMASDGRCQGKPSFEGFSLVLNVPSEAEAERVFTALSEGGQVQMPLAKTFFAPRFGMVSDRFGVTWMVIVAP